MLARTIPGRLRFLCTALFLALILLTGLRIAFFTAFHDTDTPLGSGAIASAFWLGFRFDLRLLLLLLLPMVLLWRVPRLNPTRTEWARRFWPVHLSFMTACMVLFYVVDFGNYAWLRERVDASRLSDVENPWTSLKLVWQTYPLGRALLGLAAFVAVSSWFLRKRLTRCVEEEPDFSAKYRRVATVVTILVFVCGLYGKVSFYPLRWSDAFGSTHRFQSHLALNPVLFFIDSVLASEDVPFDRKRVKSHYDEVAAYLGVDEPDPETLNFSRRVRPTPVGEYGTRRPNVYLIQLESFAYQQTGLSGNPLDASPNFDAIAKEGLLFTRFYTPRDGTARAVYATLTGIPDTIKHRTATRNPRAVDQYTIFDALSGYQKFYFLGMSAGWANLRGLISKNVRGLKLYEEGAFKSDRVDVWGVSDLHLFEESFQILQAERGDEPYFVYIQCSANHPPHNIPEDKRDFVVKEEDEETLVENGFDHNRAYNSYRFQDYALGHLMKLVREAGELENSIFFLFGDNGMRGKIRHMPPAEEAFGLGNYHTPFLIYAPGFIKEPKVIDAPCGQLDILPTIAGAVGAGVWNRTLGRNLLDPRFKEHFAFIQDKRGSATRVMLMDRDYLARINIDGSNGRLYRYAAEKPREDVSDQHPELAQRLTRLGLGIYETSKYLQYHNAPSRYAEEE
ncbi:MAG: LTA synthase family protein [Planctomycetota bacterium]